MAVVSISAEPQPELQMADEEVSTSGIDAPEPVGILSDSAPACLGASVKRMPAATMPIGAALGTLGVALLGGLVGRLLRRGGRKGKQASAGAPKEPSPMAQPVRSTAGRSSAVAAVDLSPFGSPVGITPARLEKQGEYSIPTRMALDEDEQSDNASVRDQRSSTVDAAQLHKTLKDMQAMTEENRKLSAFMAEYKADAQKLSKLEEENQALRGVTQQLEQEIQDLKANTLPRTGAELEVFKNSVRMPAAVARSVCSNDDDSVCLATASLDGARLDTRASRSNLLKQLMANLRGFNAGASQPTTPRGSNGGGGASSTERGSRSHSEETAAVGQAIFQLMDHFSVGRMM
ncbi:hypothetical protein TSOC_005393 [Tetrabaena socialis]|uniref:Uncharacterized protein n=1 Tax=Tetrabaena socialis TaxID=47790 RepID=A0A2J8A6G7_9CHLO|nr:hypothetical protein TSOC_005393 [Tetrabaena socialis]|eukprot:PNH08083.1 hypothetical protein TSOC_005393 [Tetrabaena socialis]